MSDLNKEPINNQLTIKREEMIKMINESKGKIFTVTFIKRTDKSLRTMTCRLGVKAGLVDPDNPKPAYDAKSKGLLTVWSMQDNDYRAFSLAGVTEFTYQGNKYQVID